MDSYNKGRIPYFRNDFFDKKDIETTSLNTLVIIKSKNKLFPYDDILEIANNYNCGKDHTFNANNINYEHGKNYSISFRDMDNFWAVDDGKNKSFCEDYIKFNNYKINDLDTSLKKLNKCFSHEYFKNIKKFLVELRSRKISKDLIISDLSEANKIKFKIAISKDYKPVVKKYFSTFEIREKNICLPKRKIIRISTNLPSLDGQINKENFILLNRGSTLNYRDYLCENLDSFINNLNHLCDKYNNSDNKKKKREYKIKKIFKTAEIEKQFLIVEKNVSIENIKSITMHKSNMESKLYKFAAETSNQFLAQLEYGHYYSLFKNKRKSKDDNYIGRKLELTNYKMGYRKDLNKTFRSSWEANYARILEYKKENYQFEPKKFIFKINGEKIIYLPDFKVGNKWVEVKGRFKDEDLKKIYAFKKESDKKLEVIGPIKYYELYNKYKDKIDFEYYGSINPSIKTKVVGIKFNNRINKIQKLKKDSKVKLKRDCDNQYDKNAIKVLNDANETLGFVPKELAIILAPRMDNGEKFKVCIYSILNNNNFNSLKIEIKK